MGAQSLLRRAPAPHFTGYSPRPLLFSSSVASSIPSTAPKTLELDDCQRQAVEHVSGPLLVVAGAGTGKTTVLTLRIANLVKNGHARPEQILALTYTENA